MRVRECESERVTFEPRHENKSCSACLEDQLELFEISHFQIFKKFQIFKFSLVPSFCLTFRHFFSWEPALETLNSQDAEEAEEAVKKSIAIFSYKQ